jgi:hypothetical protein
VILPVMRKNALRGRHRRTAYIPQSSFELALDRFLLRSQIDPSDVTILRSTSENLTTIADRLQKDPADPTAIDCAMLSDPQITLLMGGRPAQFRLGSGGLYEFHYCVVVRREYLGRYRSQYVRLLADLIHAEELLRQSDQRAFDRLLESRAIEVKSDSPRQLVTFRRDLLRIELRRQRILDVLNEEVAYLISKYPTDFKLISQLSETVDPSLLNEVAPERVRWICP